jgi:hypothetical protein
MPADPVVALLPVTQADRETAAGWIGGSPYDVVKAEAEMIRIGQLDNHRLVQAFARHRTPTPASGDVREASLKVGLAIQAAWNEDDLGFRNMLPPIEFSDVELRHLGAAALAASPTPDSSAVSGSAEGLREALRKIADLRIAGDFAFMDGTTVADFARAALTEGQQS